MTADQPTTDLTIDYPPELPISARRDDLLGVLGGHQVVVVAGETGSGKSTQLPKLCLELGRGRKGWIGHTQPRRLAARSIAERVASELGEEIGGTVGYAVRFTDEVGPSTRVKLMTDGILLAEIRRDPQLRRYDTLIVDEAHERSLNIDFLLGYVTRLLPQRPDLKVIITSATIDTERFAAHFGGAPIVTVSGRTYPVDIRYSDAAEESSGADQAMAIGQAVEDLFTERDGDVLVFCSGEREIRDAVEELESLGLPDTEIVPLFARLSAAEQHRVFSSHSGRRVVVATNVAETSLTVPGIRSVVDVGTARISRYNRRTKVQRLPIEPVSQASANQRAGRCGRLGPGVCVRLYSEVDFLERPEFTEPEIQRTNLAAVILQMASLGIGDVASFPFIDPPDHRSIGDGIRVLEELGAVDPAQAGTSRWLTALGRRLARLPIDPRLGRMILAAHALGCLPEVQVIAAGLWVIDPRERPTGSEQAAGDLHSRFTVPGSDLMTMLRLWEHLREARATSTSSRFRRQCRDEFINYRRVREWQDVHSQLRRVCNEMGMRTQGRSEPDADAVHRAVLTGLLSQIGHWDPERRDYRGARGSTFVINRRSALHREQHRWVMAGELVETNRLWAGQAARIDPGWLEPAAPHLVRRSHSDPWWDGEQGRAMVEERVTLFGLPIVDRRTVPLDRSDAPLARSLFIRHALIEGDWHGRYPFRQHNAAIAGQVLDVEARTRRRDLMVSDAQLFEFFDQRLGADVTSAGHFARWWRSVRREHPRLLHLEMSDLTTADDLPVDGDAFPDHIVIGDLDIDVDYRFEPGSAGDGVTFTIPLQGVHRVAASVFEWLVPGMRHDLTTALLRSLPRAERRRLSPITDSARRFVDTLPAQPASPAEELRRWLGRELGAPVDADAIDPAALPAHLRPLFRLVDASGEEIALGSDLAALTATAQRVLQDRMTETDHPLEQADLADFPTTDIPGTVLLGGDQGFPALVDVDGRVALRILASREDQERSMWGGTRRLLITSLPSRARAVRHLVDDELRVALARLELGSAAGWYHDVADGAVDHLMEQHGGPSWTVEGYRSLRRSVAETFADTVTSVAIASRAITIHAAALEGRAASLGTASTRALRSDVEEHLSRLVYPGWVTAVGVRRLADIARYLRGIDHRLDVAPQGTERDRRSLQSIRRLEDEHGRLHRALGDRSDLAEVGWMLQELRVNLFAQPVGARTPISEKRVRAALAAALGR